MNECMCMRTVWIGGIRVRSSGAHTYSTSVVNTTIGSVMVVRCEETMVWIDRISGKKRESIKMLKKIKREKQKK